MITKWKHEPMEYRVRMPGVDSRAMRKEPEVRRASFDEATRRLTLDHKDGERPCVFEVQPGHLIERRAEGSEEWDQAWPVPHPMQEGCVAVTKAELADRTRAYEAACARVVEQRGRAERAEAERDQAREAQRTWSKRAREAELTSARQGQVLMGSSLGGLIANRHPASADFAPGGYLGASDREVRLRLVVAALGSKNGLAATLTGMWQFVNDGSVSPVETLTAGG